MENLDYSEELENRPLLLAGNKRSNAMATPKERQREDAKKFKTPTPLVLLSERNTNEEERKRGAPPKPVQVPPKSLLSFNSERYMSPTDSVVSPVTRGLLTRNRRPLRLLKPWGSSKSLEKTFQGLVQEPEALPAGCIVDGIRYRG